MKIVVDLDGVIIELPPSRQEKDNVKVNWEMVNFLKYRKKLGDYIIILSATGMRSNNNDLGKVYTNNYVKVYNLLKSLDIPFDELILGKPDADLYIDDKAIRYGKKFQTDQPNFIITAAGLGKRIKELSDLPKAIVPVLNKPMMYYALKSLPLDIADKIVLIYRDERVFSTAKNVLKELGYNEIFIEEKLIGIKLDHTTSGQAETAIYAKDEVKHGPIVIYNIDTYFESYYIKSKLLTFVNNYDGIIGGFYSNSPSFSYIKVEDGIVKDIEEKKVISNIATTGLYGFRDMSLYQKYYDKYADQIKNKYGEVYVAPLYKYMINDGMSIWYDVAEVAFSLGSKAEVEYFERSYKP